MTATQKQINSLRIIRKYMGSHPPDEFDLTLEEADSEISRIVEYGRLYLDVSSLRDFHELYKAGVFREQKFKIWMATRI